MFRIAQEAFSNILKHSGAKTADISLDMDDETLLLRIADDGAGIPVGQLTAIASHGLASMRHRVRALGGTFDIAGSPGGGLLDVRIPVSRALRTHPEGEP